MNSILTIDLQYYITVLNLTNFSVNVRLHLYIFSGIISMSKKTDIKRTIAFIHGLYRFRTQVPLSLMHKITADVELYEYFIPKDAKGMMCLLFFFFFFWKGSTFSDAGRDGAQPASCVDIQNRQFTYSCRCPMYGACQNDVFCGLFCSATLAIRCRSKAPFVNE